MDQRPSEIEGVHVACGGDANYAMQVAVTLYSLVTSQPPEVRLTVYLLDGGIPADQKRRIDRVLERARPDAVRNWVTIDMSAFDGLYSTETLTAATFMRLLLPDRLPDRDRLLYLDSDVLVRGDVRELYDQPLGDDFIAGVQDFATPKTTVYKGKDIDIRPDNPYFNAGIVLMNLARFRQTGIAQDIFKFVRRYTEYHDQDGMNAFIQGRWRQMDYRWNLQNGWMELETLPDSPAKRQMTQEYDRIPERAVLVHFTNIHKPWLAGFSNPFRKEWQECLKRSGWFAPAEFARWKMGWLASATRFWLRPRLARLARKGR